MNALQVIPWAIPEVYQPLVLSSHSLSLQLPPSGQLAPLLPVEGPPKRLTSLVLLALVLPAVVGMPPPTA